MPKRLKRLTLHTTPEQLGRMLTTLGKGIVREGLQVVVEADKLPKPKKQDSR